MHLKTINQNLWSSIPVLAMSMSLVSRWMKRKLLSIISGLFGVHLINSHTFELEKNLDEDPEIILPMRLECRDTFSSMPNEIHCSFDVDLGDDLVKVTVPVRGR
jgi:hypothetical protein